MKNSGFLLLLFVCSFVFAQNNAGPLLALLKFDKEDTLKIIHLNALCEEFENNNPDTSLILCSQALSLAETLKWKKGLASSLGNFGVYFSAKAAYPKALGYFLKALKLDEELGDKNGMAIRLNNIGGIYKDQAEYNMALGYFFRALKIDEDLGNKKGTAQHIGNIGIVFYHKGDYKKALEFFLKAQKMYEELGLKIDFAINLVNLGSLYSDEADLLTGNNSSIQKDSLKQKALYYYFGALKTFRELGNINYQAAVLGNIGSLYSEAPTLPSPQGEIRKGFALAEKYLFEAIRLAKEIGAQDYERQFEEDLSGLYTKTKRHEVAMEHYKKAMALKEVLFNEEKKNEMLRKEAAFNFDKKELATKMEQEKKDARSKIILWSVIGSLILVLLFSFFAVRLFAVKKNH